MRPGTQQTYTAEERARILGSRWSPSPDSKTPDAATAGVATSGAVTPDRTTPDSPSDTDRCASVAFEIPMGVSVLSGYCEHK